MDTKLRINEGAMLQQCMWGGGGGNDGDCMSRRRGREVVGVGRVGRVGEGESMLVHSYSMSSVLFCYKHYS